MLSSKSDHFDRRTLVSIENAEERRRAIALSAAQIGIFEFEPATNRTFWDARVRELFGVGPDVETTYETVITRIHPDDRAAHDAHTAAALDPNGGRYFDFEYRLLPQGQSPMRWIHAVATCHFEGDVPVRLVGTVQDVTERRSSEEHNKMLLQELEHRVKNTFTTVISLLRHSRSGVLDLDSFITKVEDRLLSMARSHNALNKTNWRAARFDDVLMLEAEAFVEPDDPKLSVTGDAILLAARHVPIVGMALHELFTNAAKHGALSQPDGQITVHTTVQDGEATLTWTEHAVRPAKPSGGRQGFGTLLLNRVIPAELNGVVTYRVLETGAMFTLAFPNDGSRSVGSGHTHSD